MFVFARWMMAPCIVLEGLPGGGRNNPNETDYTRAYELYDESNPGGFVSLLIGYNFPADIYFNPLLFPNSPSGATNPVFYSFLDDSGYLAPSPNP